MHFLEECRKSEEEGKAGQAKAASKVKAAAATVPPPRKISRANSSNTNGNQIDALVGQVKNLVSLVKATQSSLQCGQDREPLL